METFKALILEKNQADEVKANCRDVTLSELSEGNVKIQVAYSGVNYKDALASNERAGVVRSYPQIPGIDLSGTVISSDDQRLTPGQEVLVTGFGLGVSHSGGFSQVAQVPAEWVIPLPTGLSLKDVMILGTAGFTAALAINALEKNGLTANKEANILVTGASGGVGSLALGMLKKLGYSNLTALSRKKIEAATYFTDLGIQHVLTPAEITPDKLRPLMKQQFDYVIDTVGGSLLEAIIPQISYGGSIALCGNAGGINFKTTVLPYILRGVSILGIDSVSQPYDNRLIIWNRLANEMAPENLNNFVSKEVSLHDLPNVFTALIAGTVTGRNLVKLT